GRTRALDLGLLVGEAGDEAYRRRRGVAADEDNVVAGAAGVADAESGAHGVTRPTSPCSRPLHPQPVEARAVGPRAIQIHAVGCRWWLVRENVRPHVCSPETPAPLQILPRLNSARPRDADPVGAGPRRGEAQRRARIQRIRV